MSTLRAALARALYTVRAALALALVRAARRLPAGPLTWRLMRWSILCAPHVTEAQRAAALREWDIAGYAWGILSRIPDRRGDRGAQEGEASEEGRQ